MPRKKTDVRYNFDASVSFVPDYVDTTNWTAEQFMAKRRGTKASVTKMITAIENGIHCMESSSVMRYLEKQLHQRFETYRYWHLKFISLFERSEEKARQDTAWLSEVAERVDATLVVMADYVSERSDRAPSVAAMSSADAKRRDSTKDSESQAGSVKSCLDRERQKTTVVRERLERAQLEIQLAVAKKRAESARKEEIEESISPVPASALIYSPVPVPVSVPAPTPSPVPVSVPAPTPSPAPVSAIALSQVPVPPSFCSSPVLSVPPPIVQKDPISVDRLSRRLTKLPKIGIDRFDGNIRDWPLFIGDFNSAIGSVPDYDNNF